MVLRSVVVVPVVIFLFFAVDAAGSKYISFFQLSKALLRGDLVAVDRYVDFDKVKESIDNNLNSLLEKKLLDRRGGKKFLKAYDKLSDKAIDRILTKNRLYGAVSNYLIEASKSGMQSEVNIKFSTEHPETFVITILSKDNDELATIQMKKYKIFLWKVVSVSLTKRFLEDIARSTFHK